MPPTTRRLVAGPCTVAAACGHLPRSNREWWAAKLADNVARDRRADAVLHAEGWRVLRFWEHEDPDAVADAICAALGRPSVG